MSVWSVASIGTRPSVTLRNWMVFECSVPGHAASRTRHLVGYACEDRQGQVSSNIEHFDPSTGSFKTASGRVYRLEGSSGLDLDAEYVLARWLRMWSVTDLVDVTSNVEQQLAGLKKT